MENKIKELINLLNYYTKLYDEGRPEISDKEWDDMYFTLVKLENETGIYFEDSPTQKIGYQIVNKLNKVEHDHPMLSLDKTKDINVIKSFIGDKDYICMAKMDGLTCSLTYENGNLVKAETRGNGIIGEDILHNAIVVKNIPNKINFKNKLVVDGEIICDYNSFKEFANDYKNPRNFASGSIRLLDSKECAKRKLSFIAWDCIEGFEDNNTLSLKLYNLYELGFQVVPQGGNNLTVEDKIEWIKNWAKNDKYPIDGIVFKYDNVEEYNAAGRTDHHFKGGIAYKFYDDEYETRLLDITYDVSRMGQLTPVAIFEPIEIDGTTVEKASLHNLSILKEILGIYPKIGQQIKIFKANQIIPQISWSEKIEPTYQTYAESEEKTRECLKEQGFICTPTKCPICNGKVILNDNNGVETLWCSNPQCEGKLVNRIEHFFGKGGLDAKGISKATIEKLIDWGWVSCIPDMFDLEWRKDIWVNKEGFGEKSVNNILRAIKGCIYTNLESVLSGTGIPLIGRTVARNLAKRFNTYREFREAVEGDFDFSSLDGFGYEMNKSLKNFDYGELDCLIDYYLIIEEQVEQNQEKKLNNLIICVTGKLTRFKNRDAIKTFIEQQGGKVTDSVTLKTNYLINNDINSTSSKNKKAKELGIEIITEEKFLKIFDL